MTTPPLEVQQAAQRLADEHHETVWIAENPNTAGEAAGGKRWRLTRQSELTPTTAHCAQFEVCPQKKP